MILFTAVIVVIQEKTYTRLFQKNYLFTLVRDLSKGANGATLVALKVSGTLTLFQPGWVGADSAHHWRGRT